MILAAILQCFVEKIACFVDRLGGGYGRFERSLDRLIRSFSAFSTNLLGRLGGGYGAVWGLFVVCSIVCRKRLGRGYGVFSSITRGRCVYSFCDFGCSFTVFCRNIVVRRKRLDGVTGRFRLC